MKIKMAFVVAMMFLTACQDTEINSQGDSISDSGELNKSAGLTNPEVKTMNSYSRLKQLTQSAPVATRVSNERIFHGKTLKDSYFWLKDQDYPQVNDEQVLSYLKEENAYHKAFLEPRTKLVDTIFEEFKGRTDETEESVPYRDNGYEYRWFYREGEEYRTRSRKNLSSGEEHIFLDENKLAQGHDYFVLGDWAVSPDNRLLAYSFDSAGDERYTIKILDIQTSEYLADELTDAAGSLAFSDDGKSLLYGLLDKERWFTTEIKVHKLGTLQSKDTTLYAEKDDGYFISFYQTSSLEYFVVVASQGETQESYVIKSDLSGKLKKMVDREAGFQQSVDHAHGYFYLLANDTTSNFRLARVSDENPGVENWVSLQAGSSQNYLLDLKTFDEFLVLISRANGLETIELLTYPTQATDMTRRAINFPESVFTAALGVNREFGADHVRLNYESMITPDTVYDYQVSDDSLTTRKVKKVPSGYDKTQYESERIMIAARDGVEIPVTLVYKKGFKKDASQPMWLYGYGAYSATVTPNFSTMRLSALDRGFSYAIAHVRGGSMMSYQWYLDGKLDKRMNTFNDFVDVAKGLVDRKYVAAGNISISGRSAGGELMGAAVIQAPELWRSVNLGVPFVDVLNTMLDASLPLTPPEWKEWGNPIKSSKDFDLIQGYSPYDNIQAREYPPMYVSGGLNDPRVTYWEPAKWTAKMRHLKTDSNLLVMRINMGAGHFANSGRYGRLKDYAEEYAFLLAAHEIDE